MQIGKWNGMWAVGYSEGGPNEAISVTIRDRRPGQAPLKDIFVQLETTNNLENISERILLIQLVSPLPKPQRKYFF